MKYKKLVKNEEKQKNPKKAGNKQAAISSLI